MVYRWWDSSVDFITLFNTTAGVYRRVCLMMPAILLSGYVSPVENMPVCCKT